MLDVRAVELREIRLRLVAPFVISSGEVWDRRILLVRIEDGDGAEAWGECVAQETPNYMPETTDTCWTIVRDHLAPRVMRGPFHEPEDVRRALDDDFRGNNMAKAALEMAVWALAAARGGEPLARLIGGTREKIATGISLGIQESPDVLVEKAKAALAEGYRKIKVKIKPGKDIEYVRAVREALGQDAPVMVDANNAYTLDDIEHLELLDEFGLLMIEQPLAWDDVMRHAELQRRMKTPICLDESIISLARAEDMVTLGSGRIINIKPGRVGGFSESMAIHDFCERCNVPVWCGGMLESGIGRAHNVALASLPNFSIPGDVSPSKRYWDKDIVTPEWTMDGEGYVAVPWDRPGPGVEVDRDHVENITVRVETVRKG